MRFQHSLLAFALFATGVAAHAQQVPRPAGEFAITMPNNQVTLLSQYAGKVVVLAFISTTCPHCQHTTQILSGIQNEYGSKGVQVLAAAFNPDATQLVPGFIAQFHPTFPVGSANRDSVLEYEKAELTKPNYVPEIIFIDRNRVIRVQHHGGDTEFFNNQEKNIRDTLDMLLKEPVKTAHAAHKSRS
jgi:thiol-disulfide isomerase/thioredoxin